MSKITTFINNTFTNAKAVLLREYSVNIEYEDAILFKNLLNHLNDKNSQNAFVFAIFEFLSGVFYIFTSFLSGINAPLRITGAVIHVISAIVFLILYYNILDSRTRDYSRMKVYNYVFWLVFVFGGLLLALSELLDGLFPCSCVILTLSVMIFPIMNLIESICLTATVLIPLVISAILTGGNITAWLIVIIVPVSVIWISSVHYNSVSGHWISDKRINIAEERCCKISERDSLTGFLNKNGLSAIFSERYGNNKQHKIGVILIDVDNFRVFNHMYGYDKSDSCLYSICNCIKIMAKQYTDIISRFGGDDFVLVLEDMDQIEAVKLAEQLREAVERMALTFGKGVVTISVGVSEIREYNESEDTYSILLNNADTQLMVAKKAGKNCIGFMNRPFIHEDRVIPRV